MLPGPGPAPLTRPVAPAICLDDGRLYGLCRGLFRQGARPPACRGPGWFRPCLPATLHASSTVKRGPAACCSWPQVVSTAGPPG